VKRPVLCAACLAAAATVIAGASAAELTIVPGVSIGKVKLGMSAAQVKKILGREYLVNGAQNVRGRRHVEYGWDYSRWTATFEQRGRTLRVVEVATVVPSQKTAKLIGPGSTWRELVRAYPNGICTINNDTWGRAEYLVPHSGGTQTIYFVRQPRERALLGGAWHVQEVHVRRPWMQLPEFAPSWNARCANDWRTAERP
jgi:hypothetical protein